LLEGRAPASRGGDLAARYVENDYHQPGDELDESWVFDGAVDDLRLLAELGWSIAEAASMPAYHEGDQFRRPRDATP
jgi:hypothetical protein